VQRVTQAHVDVAGETVGRIAAGLAVLLGVAATDDTADADYIAGKLLGLRVFEDAEQRMNLSVREVGGAVLLVPQFTLCGDARKGRRPSYAQAAPPEVAEPLYEAVAAGLRAQGLDVQTGAFRQEMFVSLTNHGPVTILLDSDRVF
jgi:D-aminoacyl-tRNA deacylase